MQENSARRRQQRRSDARLVRRKATRKGLPVVLVVCEGRETEPNYIRGFCEANGINAANIVISHAGTATDAASLVEAARKRFALEREFDDVFVLCDRVNENFAKARQLAGVPLRNSDGKSVRVRLVVSRPCFEFWLLLHFEYTSRVFADATAVGDLLAQHLPGYHKADRDIYAKVAAGLDRAIGHVERLRKELEGVGADTPGTDVPELILALRGLRRP